MSMQHNVLSHVVDVQKLDADNPHAAIRDVTSGKAAQTLPCDLLVVGGGMGGIASALAALRKKSSLKVILSEETDWIGGQMTAQAVSAFDENYLVETSGACQSYQDLRRRIRNYYKTNFTLSDKGSQQEYFNPGDCWVSRLSFEPLVGLKVLQDLLKPFEDTGRLSTFLRYKVVAVSYDSPAKKKVLRAVTLQNLDSGQLVEIHPKIVIDATELGDLLPLCQLPYSVGSDSKSNTKEIHAPEKADVENVQDFTFPFVLEHRPGEKHAIAKPDLYDQFMAKGKFSFQGYKVFQSTPSGDRTLLPFWTYRRLIAADNFSDDRYRHDISMINWDSNDLRLQNIIDKDAVTQSDRLAMGKLVSLGFLYWLQNEAPRDNGGKGYPEFKLLTDVLGTTDGLSKFPYIRESRRINAQKSIVESDIVASANSGARATACQDSVGIGFYPVDIHGHQEIPGAGQETRPFQIPLSALIPADAENLLPACKNIGTTHITNGAYRLHPIEWAIGEAQGTLAARILKHKKEAQILLTDEKHLHTLQQELVAAGVPIFWYDDVPTAHEHFAAIQFVSFLGLVATDELSLSFNPDAPLSRKQATLAAARFAGLSKEAKPSLPLPDGSQGSDDGSQPATIHFVKHLEADGHHPFHGVKGSDDTILTRSSFCQLIYPIVRKKFCYEG